MRHSHLVAGLVSLAAAGWIASGWLAAPAVRASTPPAVSVTTPPRVTVVESQAESRPDTLFLRGRTEALRTVAVAAETAARVAERTARKGAMVRKGEVLVRLAADDRKARLDQAMAEEERRRLAFQASEALARRDFRPPVGLAEDKAALETARARRAEAELDLARAVVRAPLDGVVDDLPVEPGDRVEAGTVVARLLELDPALVVAQIAERDRVRVREGAPARVRLGGEAPLDGRVRFVSREGDGRTRSFRAEVELANPGGRLPAGLTADLTIETGRVDAHRLPRAALALSDEGVFGIGVVDDDGRVRFLTGRLVEETADAFWVADLPPRLRLIVAGQNAVRAGQAVAVGEPAAPAAN